MYELVEQFSLSLLDIKNRSIISISIISILIINIYLLFSILITKID